MWTSAIIQYESMKVCESGIEYIVNLTTNDKKLKNDKVFECTFFFNCNLVVVWLITVHFMLCKKNVCFIFQTLLHSVHCTLATCICQSPDFVDYPSSIQVGILPRCNHADPSAPRRVLAMAAMTLKSAGSTGLVALFDGRDAMMGEMYIRLLGMNMLICSIPLGNQRLAGRFL